jgi:2-(1,2-epoxy-1,2-dihydrophenyl)acetyl-CoA isomerase
MSGQIVGEVIMRPVAAAETVLLDVREDGVAELCLNRPHAANALNLELLQALAERVGEIAGDARVRAVLLRGSGENFCAGGDVREFASRGDGLVEHLRVATALLGRVARGLVHLPAPVVAAVQGWATGGGGLGLVCASDVVLAGESARFMSGAVRVGMAPDAGSSVSLQRIVGLRMALEITLLNPILDARRALEVGIVTRLLADGDLLEEARRLASELAAGPTKSLAATKRLMWAGASASFDACLQEEARAVSELGGTADAHEGLAAVIERRAPRFGGR